MKLTGYIGISVAAIVLSWGLVHTLFALHYARLYYADAHKGAASRCRRTHLSRRP